MSKRLYHECGTEELQQIRREGLQAGPKERVARTTTKGGDYILPETVNTEDARGYGHRLVTTVLEEHRPDRFPQRDPSIWVFGNWSGDTQMIRQGLVVLNGDLVAENYSLIAADFSIAESAYLDTMNEFEFRHATSKSRLDSLCEQYWESATVLGGLSSLPHEQTEIYIPTSEIPTEYITSYQLRTEGGTYVPVDQDTRSTSKSDTPEPETGGEE